MRDIEYKIITIEEAPKELINWFEENQKQIGNHSISYDGITYVIQTLGQKNTGGYIIEVNNIVEEDAVVFINYNCILPKKNQLVTQIISYPHLIIAYKQNSKKIITTIKNNS